MKMNLVIPMGAYGATNAITNSIQKIASTGSAEVTVALYAGHGFQRAVSQKEQHGQHCKTLHSKVSKKKNILGVYNHFKGNL